METRQVERSRDHFSTTLEAAIAIKNKESNRNLEQHIQGSLQNDFRLFVSLIVNPQKFLLFFITPAAALIAVYFACLAFLIRPANDDFALIVQLREKGFTGSVIYNFTFFNFRHLPLLIFNTLFSLQDAEHAYALLIPLFYLIMLGIFTVSLSAIIRDVSLKIFDARLSHFAGICYALLFLATLYFNTFQRIEIWAYLTVTLYNLMPVIFTTAGLALGLKNNPQKKKRYYVLIALCFFIAGSGIENYSLGLLLSLVCGAAYVYRTGKYPGLRDFFKTSAGSKISVALVSLFLSACIVYLAPGTSNRPAIEAGFHNSNQPENNTVLFSFVNFLFQKSALISLVFLAGWMMIGAGLNITINPLLFRKLSCAALLLMIIFFTITLLISHLFFFNNIPARAWFPFNIAWSAFLVLLSVYFGARYFEKLKAAAWFIFPLLILVLAAFNVDHVPEMIRYAKRYDNRVQKMTAFKNKKDILFLEPLPGPGVLVSGEISPDTSRYMNKLVQSAYGLNFPIALSRNP